MSKSEKFDVFFESLVGFVESLTIPQNENDKIEDKLYHKLGKNYHHLEIKKMTKNIDKNVNEDKIFTKEDEGGAMSSGGGEVNSTVTTTSPSNGDLSLKPHGALSDDGVLGKCDHKKDGFFGKDCFHVPFPVFPVYSRLPRKKKRKHYTLKENEMDDDKRNFISYVSGLVNDKIRKAEKQLQETIDPEITITYLEDYDFEPNNQWVAVYSPENKSNMKNFPISFNLGILYEYLYSEGLEVDDLEIDIQLTISLWHEIGHALIEYFQNEGIFDFKISPKKEEGIVEEFGKYHAARYTWIQTSKLQEFIDKKFEKH